MLSKFGTNLIARSGKGSISNPACWQPLRKAEWSQLFSTSAARQQNEDKNGENSAKNFAVADAGNVSEAQQGEPIHDFSPPYARDVMSHIVNEMPQDMVINQGDHQNEAYGSHCRPQEMVSPESYEHTSHVSLYSVMQSNVPDPYSKNPNHMNMPSGGHCRQQKYISGMLNDTHPSRNYSTYAHRSVMEEYSVAPQGIQGQDCEQFQVWLDNCRRYQFGSCEEQLQGLATGRKTLKEVFEEQDRIIEQIAKDLEKVNRTKYENRAKVQELDESEMQGLQGGVPPRRPQVLPEDDASMQGSQTTYRYYQDLAPENSACPQGVQGSDCENFKLWLSNCTKYGFADCGDQIGNLKSGRKTLNEIFSEQQTMIQEIAEQYKSGQEEVSTVYMSAASSNPPSSGTSGSEKSSSSGGGSLGDQGGSGSAGNGNKNGNDKNVKLSQKDRLKQAVRDYGATVVVFHVGISLASLGGFYLAVSSGLDVVSILRSIGIGEAMLESRLAAGASTFVVAYAVHKVFAPVRIGITLTCTPFIVQYLRRVGFLKPPKVK